MKLIIMAAIAAAGTLGMVPAAQAASAGATVIRVVDGDTVRVAGASPRTVRLLGVDAPARGECFGPEAASALRRLLPRGVAVRLTKDGRRSGVYIQRGGKLVNQAMIAGGFASAGRLGGLREGGRLLAAERRAEAAGRGRWSACAGPSDSAPTDAPTAPPPVATARDQLVHALAGSVLRHFANTSGGCQTGCVQSEEALEYCTDGRFSYDFQFVESASENGTMVQRHDEGTWFVRTATLEPDGTLSGTVDVTLQRGTSIDRGEAGPGSVETQQIAITPDGATLVGGERWFRVASERCA